MAYITLDFGSSNSGAVLNTAFGNEYNPAELIYIHRQDGDAGFTKQPTVFWIKKSLLTKSYITESDINVYSCVYCDEEYYDSANFIWCQNQIKKCLPTLSNNKDWVRIDHPKMEIYKAGRSSLTTTNIKAVDGSSYPISTVLKIFFLVIKKECMHKASEAGLILNADEINWAITVPGLAIWNPDAVNFFKDIAKSVFGDKLTLLSEPECALIGINLSGKAELDFVKDRYSLVADLGGGTADICVMKETLNPDGVTSFDEVKSTKEGKDSTTSERAGGNDIDLRFYSYFCEFLAKDIEMEDSPTCLYTKFLKDNPSGAMEFEKRWRTLQFSDDIEDDVISFNPGRAYMEWLMTHCPAAAKKRDNYGEFSFDGEELRNYVFADVYKIIIASIDENLSELKKKGIILDTIYFAGGLSLDKRLKKKIMALTKSYFPYANSKESSDGSVVGAVQRGGNHISANKEKLIRRMSRKTFYTEFSMKYNGNKDDFKKQLSGQIRGAYWERFNRWLEDNKLKEIIDQQIGNMVIDYSNSRVNYLLPLCLKFAPVTQVQSFCVSPAVDGQKGAAFPIFSSDKDYILFKGNDVKYEGEFEYDFGYEWKEAMLIFDPTSSSAVEGTALFYLTNENGVKLKEHIIQNVSKRGI